MLIKKIYILTNTTDLHDGQNSDDEKAELKKVRAKVITFGITRIQIIIVKAISDRHSSPLHSVLFPLIFTGLMFWPIEMTVTLLATKVNMVNINMKIVANHFIIARTTDVSLPVETSFSSISICSILEIVLTVNRSWGFSVMLSLRSARKFVEFIFSAAYPFFD